MICFKKPTDSPTPYCIAELSDGREAFETNIVQFWRQLKKFCDEHALQIKQLYIIDEEGSKRKIKRNNIIYYFIIREGKFSLRGGQKNIKKGYGVICVHPGGIKKSYIDWYDDKNGKFVYTEVKRDAEKVHEEVLGIQAAR